MPAKVSRDHPVVISKYITGAKEVEMDGIGKADEIWETWAGSFALSGFLEDLVGR